MKKILIVSNIVLVLGVIILLTDKFSPKKTAEYTWKTTKQTVVISYNDGKQVEVYLNLAPSRREVTEADIAEIAPEAYKGNLGTKL